MIADGVFRTPGEFAGYLGKEHDPLFITRDPNDPGFSVEELTLPIEVPLSRVSNRQALRSGLAAHAQLNFKLLRQTLLPTTEQTLPTLIEDLDSRGLLDETLVVWTGEFGRTPKINKDAGRDHWPQCYTLLMAGGSVKRGFVYGGSDKTASYPKDNPCSPDDVAATMFYCMGIDPATELRNHVNQPVPVSRGMPIMPVIA